MGSEESSLYREPLTDKGWSDALRYARERMSGRDRVLAVSIVSRIDRAIAWLDPVMAGYCEQSCPTCGDPCCHGKRIFYNFADLLVLTVRDTSLPPGQTRTATGEGCRYLTSAGCALSRYHRPYVCVWFLCEPQMKLLQEESVRFQRTFLGALLEIREGRVALEALAVGRESDTTDQRAAREKKKA